jgi:hypothetical protein
VLLILASRNAEYTGLDRFVLAALRRRLRPGSRVSPPAAPVLAPAGPLSAS